MKRKIPVTMATQHPDNALMPDFLTSKKTISTQDEIEESFRMFSEFNVDEYMWDWEGKFADEAVIDKLLRHYFDYFKKQQLGKDKFLTFRIPNIWQEKGYRLARAFMSILTAEDFTNDLKLHSPPIFEIILPMTTSHKQMLHVQDLFQKTAQYKKEVFHSKNKILENIEIIPLFEEIDVMMNCTDILKKYLTIFQKTRKKPEYMRIFIARSDPALNAGLVPAVIASKVAISKLRKFSIQENIKIYPWLGAGSLPFRGGVNPENYKNIVEEYCGLSSITIQSAFRYDYPFAKVKKAISYLNKHLGEANVQKNCLLFSNEDIKKINEINKIFEKIYQVTIEKIADKINFMADYIPSRRERMLHIGLFGYSRGIGKVQLPRAIKFTGALYALGIPPEIIATGRGLKEIDKKGYLPFLKKIYLFLKEDLLHAGHYLNRENLEFLIQENKAWKEIKKDIEYIEKFLKISLGPTKTKHFIHRNLVSTIYFKSLVKDDFKDELVEAAIIRKSLG